MHVEDQTEIAKVRENLKAWLEAFNAKDADALFALYDEESVYANAGAALMRGIEEIRPWYEQAFAAVEGTLLYKEEAALQDGNLAMLLGVYYFQPPAGATLPEEAHMTGRVALVYRRNEAGEWRLLFDMDNTPPDVSPASFA